MDPKMEQSDSNSSPARPISIEPSSPTNDDEFNEDEVLKPRVRSASSPDAAVKRGRTPPLKLDVTTRVTLGMFPGTVPFAEPGIGVSDDSDSVSLASNSSVSAIIPRQKYGVTAASIPSLGAITLAEFKHRDTRPRTQRMILYHISQSQSQFNPSDPTLTAKQKKETLKKQQSSQGKGVSSAFSKINNLLKSKKKKRPLSSTFHLLALSIHDHRTSHSCQLIEEMSGSSMRKKQPAETNACFLHAASNGLESVCLQFYERGFPQNINSPILGHKTLFPPPLSSGPHEEFQFPSYFILMVGIGLDNVVRAMVKRANVNQTWFGLTPLHIASAKGNLPVIKSLVESNADVFTGLPLEAYYLFLNLKSDAARSATASMSIPSYKSQWKKNVVGNEERASSVKEDNVESYKSFVKERRIFSVELACMAGHSDTARFLLAKYDAKQAGMLTACFHPHQEIDMACAFLRAGASPENCLDPWGSNAVHIAARMGKLALLATYQSGGKINFNKKGRNGWTALHEATSTKSMSVARYLVRIGCDTSIVNDAGETAMDLAKRVGIPEEQYDSYFVKQTEQSDEELKLEERIKQAFADDKASSLALEFPSTSRSASKRKKGGAPSLSEATPTATVEAGWGKVRSSSESGSGFLRGLMGGKGK